MIDGEPQVDPAAAGNTRRAWKGFTLATALAIRLLDNAAEADLQFLNLRYRRRAAVVGGEDVGALGRPDAAGRDVAEDQLAPERGDLLAAVDEPAGDGGRRRVVPCAGIQRPGR